MPPLQELLECLKALLRLDESWLPDRDGYSLYIRPFMFASSFSLGIAPPSRTTITIVCSPVGPYFPSGTRNSALPNSCTCSTSRILLSDWQSRPEPCAQNRMCALTGACLVPHAGLQPIQLFLDEEHVRAWPGGVGANKVASNYGPTIVPQMEAAANHGAKQVCCCNPQLEPSSVSKL